MTTCPHCSGRRTFLACVDGVRNGKRFGEMRELACFTCLGKGEVSEEQLRRIQKGKTMAEDRKARNVSIREEAKRLGISPVELSDREHGKLGEKEREKDAEPSRP